MRVWRLRPLIHSASASLHVIVKGLAAEFPNATAEVQRQLWINFYSQSLPESEGKSKSDIELQTPDMEPTAAAPPGGSFEVAYQQQVPEGYFSLNPNNVSPIPFKENVDLI